MRENSVGVNDYLTSLGWSENIPHQICSDILSVWNSIMKNYDHKNNWFVLSNDLINFGIDYIISKSPTYIFPAILGL